jgi:hypothetical protein
MNTKNFCISMKGKSMKSYLMLEAITIGWLLLTMYAYDLKLVIFPYVFLAIACVSGCRGIVAWGLRRRS